MKTPISTADFESMETPGALIALAEMFDRSSDLNDVDGLDLGLTWADTLAIRPLTSLQTMTLEYFRGSAWLEKHAQALRRADRGKHDWSQPELEKAVLSLRSVLANESFGHWPKIRRAQLYTNLGNAFSTLGRMLDAIEYRDAALRLVPRFGMGLGTRAESIDAFRGTLHRRRDKHAYVAAAADGFAAASASDAVFENPGYGPVIERWAKRRDELLEWLAEHPAETLPEFSTEPATDERIYRRWCLDQRLMLNPLNELGPLEAASTESLHLPPIAPHDSRAELLFGYLDSMKQEFCSARWSFYESLYADKPHFSDKRLAPHDTGDEPLHGLWIERMKNTYRSAYSIFDKLALFLNVYFAVGLEAGDVTFSRIWREKKKVLRRVFATSNNWPLRGLYWIARDLAERGFKDVIEPDAKEMAELRNYVEHRFVRVVKSYGSSGQGAQGLLYIVRLDEFQRRTMKLLQLARKSLIMLVSAVYVEEHRRGPGRGPWTVLPPLNRQARQNSQGT